MSKKKGLIDLKVFIKGMEPIQLECKQDSQVLRTLCARWAGRAGAPNEIMYLEIEGDARSYLYFPISSLVGIESSTPLPEALFLSNEPGVPPEYAHLNIDPRWLPWVENKLQQGGDKDQLFRHMYDKGVDYDVIATLLKHRLRRPIPITEREDRESIHPLSRTKVDSKYRFDSEYIELYRIDRFLPLEQCALFEALVEDNAARSTVRGMYPLHEGRTSSTYRFPHSNDVNPDVRDLQQRICDLLQTDMILAEPLTCLTYAESQQFRAHKDYYSEGGAFYQSFDGERRWAQRQWSVLIYLTNVEEGSGTRFHRIRHEFTPAKGTALIWNNLYPSGNPNPYSHHIGLPAAKEKKIVLTQMFRRGTE